MTNEPLSDELRELLAKREEARTAIREAELELIRRRGELSKLAAEIIRRDSSGTLSRVVARW